MTARLGSLFSGTGAMDLAVCEVLGATVAWHCETEPAANRVLAHHWPGVPNLGDIAAVDWATVEPVDVLTAGWPCQPWSQAGRRRGSEDERALWPEVAGALRVLRPGLFVGENVPAVVGAGELGRALGDLAALGFDAEWAVLPASSVGAPHRRERLFLAAWPAGDPDCPAGDQRWFSAPRQAEVGGPRSHLGGSSGAPTTDTPGAGWGQHEPVPVTRNGRAPVRSGQAQPGRRDCDAAADTEGERRGEGWPEPAGQLWGPDATQCGDAAPDAAGITGCVGNGERVPAGNGRADTEWAGYAPAIQRWERSIGRPAPAPTVLGRRGGRQLSPLFVEWLMGLPAGWVTAVPGVRDRQQVKLLGNGVVPQQCAAAVRGLLDTGPNRPVQAAGRDSLRP